MKRILLIALLATLGSVSWGQDTTTCTHGGDNIVETTTCVFSDGHAIVSSYYPASEQSTTERFTPAQWRVRVQREKRAEGVRQAQAKAAAKVKAAADEKMSSFKTKSECTNNNGQWWHLRDSDVCKAKVSQ